MHKNRKLWQAALAVSVSSALAFPAFVHGQSGTSELSGAKSVHSSSKVGAGSSEHGQKAVGGKSASRIRHKLAPNEFFTQADRDLVKRVQETLRADSSLAVSAQKIDITAKQGKVVLRGAVKDDQEKVAIATKVQRTMGVEGVENRLQVSGELSSRESTNSPSTDTAHRSDRGGMGSSGNSVSR